MPTDCLTLVVNGFGFEGRCHPLLILGNWFSENIFVFSIQRVGPFRFRTFFMVSKGMSKVMVALKVLILN